MSDPTLPDAWLPGQPPAHTPIEMPNSWSQLALRAAADPSYDLARLKEVLMIRDSEEAKQHRRIFRAKWAQVQAEVLMAARDRANNVTHSRYSTLAKLWAIAKPALDKYGFTVRFSPRPDPREGWQQMTIIIELADNDYSIEETMSGPVDIGGMRGQSNKTGIQAIGSTATYLRRYLLALTLQLVSHDDPEDNDGNPVQPGGNGKTPPAPDDIDPRWERYFALIEAMLERADEQELRKWLIGPTLKNNLATQKSPAAEARLTELVAAVTERADALQLAAVTAAAERGGNGLDDEATETPPA